MILDIFIKIIGIIIVGVILTLSLDFILFSAVKVHYFDVYRINEYFNLVFVDKQCWLLFFPVAILFGTLFQFANTIFQCIYIVLLSIAMSAFYQPFGYKLGTAMFMEDKVLVIGETEINGKLLYKGRTHYHFYRDDIEKTVTFKIGKYAIKTY